MQICKPITSIFTIENELSLCKESTLNTICTITVSALHFCMHIAVKQIMLILAYTGCCIVGSVCLYPHHVQLTWLSYRLPPCTHCPKTQVYIYSYTHRSAVMIHRSKEDCVSDFWSVLSQSLSSAGLAWFDISDLLWLCILVDFVESGWCHNYDKWSRGGYCITWWLIVTATINCNSGPTWSN